MEPHELLAKCDVIDLYAQLLPTDEPERIVAMLNSLTSGEVIDTRILWKMAHWVRNSEVEPKQVLRAELLTINSKRIESAAKQMLAGHIVEGSLQFASHDECDTDPANEGRDAAAIT